MSIIHFAGDTWLVRVERDNPKDGALRIASALGELAARQAPDSTVYVAHDARPLSGRLAPEVSGAVAAYGVRVVMGEGHCTMPALAEATRRNPESFAALMLTADYRPGDYFGVRVRMADGSSATPADLEEFESHIPAELPDERGAFERIDLMAPYLAGVSSVVGGEAIARARPRVVVDPMHGSARVYAARLLESLGASVTEIHGEQDEDFGGLHPEACEPWIDDCEQAVEELGATMGVAIDGGGERIALVDERGRMVTPHKTVALILGHLVQNKGMRGRVVIPIYGSSIVRRQAERLGCELTVAPAGYVWMREEMAEGDVLLAGDALGGVCVPQIGLERDAMAAAAFACELVSHEGRPLSELSDGLDEELGRMEYGRRDVRLGSGAAQALRNMLPGVNPASVAGRRPVSVSHSGGLGLRFGDESWLLVRPSRTEALVRVYAEAPDAAARDELLSEGASIARRAAGMGH